MIYQIKILFLILNTYIHTGLPHSEYTYCVQYMRGKRKTKERKNLDELKTYKYT